MCSPRRSSTSAASAYPRYHLEMALLRWIHLRKLVPISDLIQGAREGGPGPARARSVPRHRAVAPAPRIAASPPGHAPCRRRLQPRRSRPRGGVPRRRPAPAVGRRRHGEGGRSAERSRSRRAPASNGDALPNVQPVAAAELKDAFLTRSASRRSSSTAPSSPRRSGSTSTAIASSSRSRRSIARCATSSIRSRAWLDALASQLSGRKMTVASAEGAAPAERPALRRRPRGPPGKGSPVRSASAGAGRFRSAGDARRVRGRNQGCRGEVVM